jgi:carboxyl-terminal processing protease
MSPLLRAFLAAALVAIVAVAGAFVIGLRSAGSADAGGIASIARTAPSGDQLASLAFRQVQHVYYKPVEAQALVNGERAGILAALKGHVAGANLPAGSVAEDATLGDGTQAAQTLALAQRRYAAALGANGSRTLTEAALRGMLGSVNDPYTVYLSPRENRSLSESLDGGNFGGIGVYIFQLKDRRVVLQPIEDLPASHAGMKIGEVVTKVDGTPVAGLSLDRVEGLIRGNIGTTVRLETYPFKSPKTHRTYAIVRQQILVPTVHAEIKDGYEYIRLSDFGATSAAEVKKALLSGRAHNARGYILDLRNNGGGLVDAAVKISSYFIPSGTIVSTISRDGDRLDDDALGTSIPGLKPLVILVNKYTASASEITSGALQDYHLATLVGMKTFGKGVVQSIYPMPDGGALKITTQRYVTPMGRDIQHRGIVPDIVVVQNADDPSLIGTAADKQLKAAEARLAQLAR